MEGFRRVVLGSAVGGLLGAASFFAVDGLMPREANANPFANLTDLEMQDAWVHVVVWGQTCLSLAGHVEVEEVEDRIFSFLKKPPRALSEPQILDSLSRVGASAIEDADRNTCPKEMLRTPPGHQPYHRSPKTRHRLNQQKECSINRVPRQWGHSPDVDGGCASLLPVKLRPINSPPAVFEELPAATTGSAVLFLAVIPCLEFHLLLQPAPPCLAQQMAQGERL